MGCRQLIFEMGRKGGFGRSFQGITCSASSHIVRSFSFDSFSVIVISYTPVDAQAGRKYLYKPTPGSLKFTPWNYSLPAPTPAMRASNYYTFRFNSYVDILLQMTANPFGGMALQSLQKGFVFHDESFAECPASPNCA